MATRHVYDRQAERYDETRGASPSVLGPLRQALSGAPGTRLIDVGGGTGNYAAALRAEGWDPVVVDLNAPMLARAAAKGLATVQADAGALPFADRTTDAVMFVSMLHHVPDWRAALAEGRRVLRPGGRLALMGWAREHMEQVTWISDYFPSMRDWLRLDHPTLDEITAELPGAELIPMEFTDLADGSLAALQRRPRLLLDPARHDQTSYFEKLKQRFPDELEAGLARLRADLDAGIDPDAAAGEARARYGDALVLGWTA